MSREKLPETRAGITRKFKIARAPETCELCKQDRPRSPLKLWVQINTYPDGRPAEMFIKADNHALIGGALDAAAIAVSMALQHGVPFEDLMQKWVSLRFEPAGATGDPAFPLVASPLDYIARWALTKFGKPT
jgi:ribonucleoside-diphosphate reductase alpha chain